MTDRPIIFSAPMVRALLDGRKTQTRRLATSPLRKCEVGDRLYVREAWRTHRVRDDFPPRLLTGEGRVWFEADRDNCDQHGRLRPGMHMPRWASRLTLVVEAVRVEPLQAISMDDAMAEGVEQGLGLDCRWRDYLVENMGIRWQGSPRASYKTLWISLHGEESWNANPDVVALTFRVERGNIDRIGA